MSRARSIVEGLWQSEQVCELARGTHAHSRDTRLLFLGLITISDDCGFATASPHALRLAVFPSDPDISRQSIANMFDDLIDSGLVEVYQVNGQRHSWIPTWFRWQVCRWRSRSQHLDDMMAAGLFEATVDDRGQVKSCCPTDLGRSRQVRATPAQDCGKLPQTSADSRSVPQTSEDSRKNGGPYGTFPDVSRREGFDVTAVDVPKQEASIKSPPAVPASPASAEAVNPAISANGTTAGEVESPKRPHGTPQAGIIHMPLHDEHPERPPEGTEGGPRPNPKDCMARVQALLDAEPDFRQGLILRAFACAMIGRDAPMLLAHILEVERAESCDSRCAMLLRRMKPGDKEARVPGDTVYAEAKEALYGEGPRPSSLPTQLGEVIGGALSGTPPPQPHRDNGMSEQSKAVLVAMIESEPSFPRTEELWRRAYAIEHEEPLRLLALVTSVRELDTVRSRCWTLYRRMSTEAAVVATADLFAGDSPQSLAPPRIGGLPAG